MPRVILLRWMSGVHPISLRTLAYGCGLRRTSAAMREFELSVSVIGRPARRGARGGVAGKRRRFGVPEMDRKQDRDRNGVAAQLGGNELEFARAAQCCCVEIGEVVRFFHARRVGEYVFVVVDV